MDGGSIGLEGLWNVNGHALATWLLHRRTANAASPRDGRDARFKVEIDVAGGLMN